MRVAVVGATGAVGRQILAILQERAFPLDELVLFGTGRSRGTRLPFGGEELEVRVAGDGWYRGVDLALVSAGSAAAERLLPPAAAAGTVCVDNSSAFRMAAGVPLVVPHVNPEALREHAGIIANGNCTAITTLMAVAPLHRAFGLEMMITSSYQSVSGSGMKGVRELEEQVARLQGSIGDLVRPDAASLPSGPVFGRTIAFNVVPRCESPDPAGSGYTTEELKMGAEVRKVLGLPGLPVVATAARVPVVAGHAVSIYGRFSAAAPPEDARAVLGGAPGVRLTDDLDAGEFPTPLDAAGRDDVLVGRVRSGEDGHSLALFVSGDNLRRGAALSVVELAELLVGADPTGSND